MERVGLVIQGPLVSKGKDGRFLHATGVVPERDYIAYDCRRNIQQLIDDFGHLFSHIVVSTWKNELREDDTWRGASVVASDDKLLPKKNIKGTLLPDNRFRQMFSTLAGIEYLEKNSDVDMVLKIRTDQYLNLNSILESMRQYQTLPSYSSKVIFVPAIMRGPLGYGIRDFYFAGNIQTMKEFTRSIFTSNAFGFHPNVHLELWLKYAYEAYRKEIGVPEYAYFAVPYVEAYCEEARSILKFLFQNVFWPLSFACQETIIWRGKPIGEDSLEYERDLYLFQETGFKDNLTNIDSLLPKKCSRFLGIHWRRYAQFRERILENPLSFTENMFIWMNTGAALVYRIIERSIHYLLHPGKILQRIVRL